MAAEEIWPSFRCASFMFIFMAAAWALLVSFDVSKRYRPLEWGMVAMVRPFGFFMVHICLWNMTLLLRFHPQHVRFHFYFFILQISLEQHAMNTCSSIFTFFHA